MTVEAPPQQQSPAGEPPGKKLSREGRIALWALVVAVVAVLVGGFFDVLQLRQGGGTTEESTSTTISATTVVPATTVPPPTTTPCPNHSAFTPQNFGTYDHDVLATRWSTAIDARVACAAAPEAATWEMGAPRDNCGDLGTSLTTQWCTNATGDAIKELSVTLTDGSTKLETEARHLLALTVGADADQAQKLDVVWPESARPCEHQLVAGIGVGRVSTGAPSVTLKVMVCPMA
jgi:hypothetical protein